MCRRSSARKRQAQTGREATEPGQADYSSGEEASGAGETEKERDLKKCSREERECDM